MTRTATYLSLAGIELDRDQPRSLQQQLYDALREMILSGQLPAGTRIPPTRALCTELEVSRITVVTAIKQLTSEGYVHGIPGRGTFVAEALPESMLTMDAEPTSPEATPLTHRLSKRGAAIVSYPMEAPTVSHIFQPGVPDVTQFPWHIWQRIVTRILKTYSPHDVGYADAAGYSPLREAIAKHVQITRRVRCTPEQVIITTGTQQAIYLTAQLLLEPGDKAWLENPGYIGAVGALQAAEVTLVPVPVDQGGLDVSAGIARAADAKLAYVTPSHQYPNGGTLDLTRRMQLLEWAKAANAFLIEDDYDSEFRYTGHPLASLQGLDQHQRVIYIGTFSKTLFPGLRLGYAIVPPGLQTAFATARSNLDRGSEWMSQKALSEFMAEGHFVRHIRRMRTLYGYRQQVLIEALQQECADWLSVEPAPAGLHLMGKFKHAISDQRVAEQLRTVGIAAPALARYTIAPLDYGGLVFGYGATDEGEIRASVRKLRKIFEEEGMRNG